MNEALITTPKKPLLAKDLGKVAVLYGGFSAEREISLRSGQAVIGALKASGVDVIAIDTQHNALEQLQQAKPDRIFIALHGVGGEDGQIQGLLEYLKLPYTGSGVLASSLCMDKLRTKQLWLGVGLPTAKYADLNEQTNWQQVIDTLGGQAMVKPAREGSSIGMSRVHDAAQLNAAYEHAAKYDASVLAEQFIEGSEYTVAIFDGQALPPIRLLPNSDFYDYNAKYFANDTQYLCPCGLETEVEKQLQDLALKAFQAVGASGWGRVDVMANQDGEFFLLEVNTVPGLTDHSLVPMAAKAAGIEFNELILRIASQAVSE